MSSKVCDLFFFRTVVHFLLAKGNWVDENDDGKDTEKGKLSKYTMIHM